MNTARQRSLGFWILTGIGAVLNIFYLLGQTMTIINYDFTVTHGLQESQKEITAVGIALNKGFGFGDTLFYIPLFIAGIIGLFKRKAWAIYFMFGAMAITIYWPIVSLATLFYAQSTPGWSFTDYTSYSIILSMIVIYGVWSLYFLYLNRNELVDTTSS